MKFPLPKEHKYVEGLSPIWYGEPHMKQSLVVPEIAIKYGSMVSKVKSMPYYFKALRGALSELSKSVKSNTSNPYIEKTTISEADLNALCVYIEGLGISGIGYTQVNESHMFKDSVVLFKNAIVLTMEMARSEIDLAPSIRTNIEIFRTYYELGKAVNAISDFLRERGYNAQPIAAISNNLNLVVLAKDAGLGGFGKHGLLITETFGPSVRLAAVLTDIENLPKSDTTLHEWIPSFCDHCNACVKGCPAGAIYHTPIKFEDGSEAHIDYKKCALPFSKDFGCTLCIKNCTFYKTQYHKIKNSLENKNG